MGTPEFPNLGKHCDVEDCKQIDFLPFTCDLCRKVYCLEHRSYSQHHCPRANREDVTVVICPLCAKGVRLIPDQDPNITWESHVNTECDPSNYEKVTKKRKCPAPGCREVLVFSNTINCRDCQVDHCLKHRFGPDHKCPGSKKSETGFQFMSLLSRSRQVEPKPSSRARPTPTTTSSSSSTWARFVNAASKLGSDFSQTFSGQSSGGSGSYPAEVCPQCYAKFSSVAGLVEHVKKVHERSGSNGRVGVRKVTIDVCPKCSRGFRDPVLLVEHVERDHGGTSRA